MNDTQRESQRKQEIGSNKYLRITQGSQSSAKKSENLSKSYADIRVKLGQYKDELASIPSEISDDEWAEIAKYQ